MLGCDVPVFRRRLGDPSGNYLCEPSCRREGRPGKYTNETLLVLIPSQNIPNHLIRGSIGGLGNHDGKMGDCAGITPQIAQIFINPAAVERHAFSLPSIQRGENHIPLEDDPGWPRFLEELRRFLDQVEAPK